MACFLWESWGLEIVSLLMSFTLRRKFEISPFLGWEGERAAMPVLLFFMMSASPRVMLRVVVLPRAVGSRPSRPLASRSRQACAPWSLRRGGTCGLWPWILKHERCCSGCFAAAVLKQGWFYLPGDIPGRSGGIFGGHNWKAGAVVASRWWRSGRCQASAVPGTASVRGPPSPGRPPGRVEKPHAGNSGCAGRGTVTGKG